jgi:hypothetical protein
MVFGFGVCLQDGHFDARLGNVHAACLERVDDQLIPLQMPSPALLTQRQTVFKVF